MSQFPLPESAPATPSSQRTLWIVLGAAAIFLCCCCLALIAGGTIFFNFMGESNISDWSTPVVEFTRCLLYTS